MKQFLRIALALILLALPVTAGADTSFTLTGSVSKIQCTEIPTFQAPSMLQCTMSIAPDPGLTSQVVVHCMDPEVAEACSVFIAGDSVMIIGHEVAKTKMVDKIGIWMNPR